MIQAEVTHLAYRSLSQSTHHTGIQLESKPKRATGSVTVGRDRLAAGAGGQGAPGRQRHGVLAELDVAVAEEQVHACLQLTADLLNSWILH